MRTVENETEFSETLVKNDIVVVDVGATWCGPCNKFSPEFEKISNVPKYKKVVFLKADADENEFFSDTYSVSVLPTILIFHKGKEAGRIRGGKVDEIKASLDKICK